MISVSHTHYTFLKKGDGGVTPERERDFFIDNLLVRIHFIIVMIRWTGLAPWELPHLARHGEGREEHVGDGRAVDLLWSLGFRV